MKISIYLSIAASLMALSMPLELEAAPSRACSVVSYLIHGSDTSLRIAGGSKKFSTDKTRARCWELGSAFLAGKADIFLSGSNSQNRIIRRWCRAHTSSGYEVRSTITWGSAGTSAQTRNSSVESLCGPFRTD